MEFITDLILINIDQFYLSRTYVFLKYIVTSNFIHFTNRGTAKLEEATELYARSGNAFKMAKKWSG